MAHDDDGCTTWVKREYVGYGADGVISFNIQSWAMERGEVFIILDLGRLSWKKRSGEEGTHLQRSLGA